MTNHYRITIRNRSAKPQRFLLFNEAPKAETSTSHIQTHTTVWAAEPGVPGPHGTTNFKINTQQWAITGTSRNPLADKVVVDTADAAPVHLNTGRTPGTQTYLAVHEGAAAFDATKAAKSSVPAGFSIQTASYDGSEDPLVFCGLGRQNPHSADDDEDIVPVCVWAADPNELYEVTPREVFYVATGDVDTGAIVRVEAIAGIARIDFGAGSGAGKGVAVVEFTRTHEFTAPVFEGEGGDGDVR